MPKDKKTGNEKISYDNEYLAILMNTTIMQQLPKANRDKIEQHIRNKDKSTAELTIKKALAGIGSSVDALNDELEDIDEDYNLRGMLSQAIRIESDNRIQSCINRGGVDAILDKELSLSTRDLSCAYHVKFVEEREQRSSQLRLISIRFADSECRAEMRLDQKNKIQSFDFYNHRMSVMSDSFGSLFAHVNRSQSKRIEVKPRDSHGHETPLFDEGMYDLSFKSSEKLSQNVFQMVGSAIQQTFTSGSDAKSRDARVRAQHCETYIMKHRERVNFSYTLKIYTEKSDVLAVDVVCKNARTSRTRKVTLYELSQYKVSWFDDRHRVESDAVFLRKSAPNPERERLKMIEAIHEKQRELIAYLTGNQAKSDLIKSLNELTTHHLIDKESISQAKEAEIDELTALNKLRSDPKVTRLLEEICVLYQSMASSEDITPESIRIQSVSILIESILDAGYRQVIPKEKKDAIRNLNTLRILEETFEHIDRLNGKDLIMFLGNTGAGKSTSINYFSGIPLTTVKTAYGETRLIVDEKRRAKRKINPEHCPQIGSSLGVSETVHVQGYPIVRPPKKPEKGGNLLDYPGTLLCDTPGFRDTRGIDYELSAKVSIEQAVRGARDIRAIVLTLPYESFLVDRASAVVKLMEDLEQRVPHILDDTSLNTSIFLLITKHSVHKNAETGIEDKLKQLCDEAQNQLRNSSDKESYKLAMDKQKVAIWTLLQRMKNQGRICFIDAEDKLGRKDILRSYMHAPGIPKGRFSRFLDREDILKRFSYCTQVVTGSYLDFIMIPFLEALPEKIQKTEQTVKDEKEKIRRLQEQKIKTESDIQDNNEEIASLTMQLAELDNRVVESSDQRVVESSDQMDAELRQRWQKIVEKIKQEVAEQRQRNIAQYKANISREEKEIHKKQASIKKLKGEVDSAENGIRVREEKIRAWSEGSENITLWHYDERSPDDRINFFRPKENARKDAIREVRHIKEDEIEKRGHFTAGDYVGKLVHSALIERKYRVIPEDEEHKSRFMSGQSAGGYTAIMKGHKMTIHPNYQPNATSDGQKMIYTMLSTWDGEQPLPHGEIVHRMPKHEIYSASIANARGEITFLTRTLGEKRADLASTEKIEKTKKERLKQLKKELSDENDQMEKEIAEAHKNNWNQLQEDIRKEIAKSKKEFNQNLSKLRANVKNSEKNLEEIGREIEEAHKAITTAQKACSSLQWERRRLALILRRQSKTFELLKRFVDFMLDKNSAMNVTSLSRTQGQARLLEKQCEKYKKYYDANRSELEKAYAGKGVLKEKAPEIKAEETKDTNGERQQEAQVRGDGSKTPGSLGRLGLFSPESGSSSSPNTPSSVNRLFADWVSGNAFDVSGLPFDEAIRVALQRSLAGSQTASTKTPGSSADSHSQLIERGRQYGYDCHNVDGDGNCFFRAVAHQLQRLGQPESHDTLRAQAAAEVGRHATYYGNFMAGSVGEAVTQMARPGEWVGQIATQAIARLKRVIIVVIPHDGSSPVVMKPRGADRVMVLGNQVNYHFQSLIPQQAGTVVTEAVSKLIDAAEFLESYSSEQSTHVTQPTLFGDTDRKQDTARGGDEKQRRSISPTSVKETESGKEA